MDSIRPLAVITGASSGIGEGFAEAFAAQGADLFVIARRGDRLEALAARLRGTFQIAVEILVADLTDSAALTMVEETLGARGRIDFLVNSAGFGTYDNFSDIAPERIRNELLLDLVAPVALTRAVLPAMLANKAGTIINVSSMAGFLPIPRHVTYCTAKAGLTRFTETLHGELAGTGVRVHALCPGPVPTEFFAISGYKLEDVPPYMLQSVTDCVRAAFKGLNQPGATQIPHRFIWWFVTVMTRLPLFLQLKVLGGGPEWLNGKKQSAG